MEQEDTVAGTDLVVCSQPLTLDGTAFTGRRADRTGSPRVDLLVSSDSLAEVEIHLLHVIFPGLSCGGQIHVSDVN